MASPTALSARERVGAWLLGCIETPLTWAVAVWLLASPALFHFYYPLLRPAPQAHDAEAVVRWLASTYRTRSLNIAATGGQFGPQELHHYSDVRAVFQRVPGCAALLALAWLAAFLAARPSWKVLAAAQTRGLLFWLALLLVVGGLALWDWPLFFALVHRPFFGDRSWRLPDDAYSLQLFPASFWRLLACSVLLSPLAVFALLRGIGKVGSLARVVPATRH